MTLNVHHYTRLVNQLDILFLFRHSGGLATVRVLLPIDNPFHRTIYSSLPIHFICPRSEERIGIYDPDVLIASQILNQFPWSGEFGKTPMYH